MLIPFERSTSRPIFGLLFSTILLCVGCSEPAPSSQTTEAAPDAAAAQVVIAPTFAPAAGSAAGPSGPAVPGGAPTAGAPTGGAVSAGRNSRIQVASGPPAFTAEPELALGSQPVLNSGILSWFDPETKEPCAREIGVASNGDLALLEPLTAKAGGMDNTGPPPTKFPIHALLTWEDFRTELTYNVAAMIDSPIVVRITNGTLHESAPGTKIRPGYRETRNEYGTIVREREPWKPNAAQPAAKQPDPPVPVDAALALPGEVTAAFAGAEGRYLVLSIPSQKQVLIVDVPEKKIAKTIPTSEDILIAAGKTKFVLLDAKTGMLSRWSFATLESELSTNIGGTPALVAMSEWGEGPIWVVDKAKTDDDPASIRLFYLGTLGPVKAAINQDDRSMEVDLINFKNARTASVSEAGDVIFITNPNTSALVWKYSAKSAIIEKVEFPRGDGLFVTPVGKSVRPMADGRTFLQGDEFVDGKTRVFFDRRSVLSFPFSTTRNCFAVSWEQITTVKEVRQPAPLVVNYHPNAAAEAKAQIRLVDIGLAFFDDNEKEELAIREKRPFLTLARRCNFDPASKTFSCINTGPDRVMFKKLDQIATPAGSDPADASVAGAKGDEGAPAPDDGLTIKFAPETPVDFQLSPKVLPAGATATLDFGPPGAKITKEGKISWLPGKDPAGVRKFVVEITPPGEMRRFVILQAEPAEPSTDDAVQPSVEPRRGAARGYSESSQRDHFKIDVDRVVGFLVKPTGYTLKQDASEEPPTASNDRYVPAGAEARLIRSAGFAKQAIYRMPGKKSGVSVDPILTPYRFVRAQGRPQASIESKWIGMRNPTAVVDFPESIVDSVPAGDGRYLLLSLPTIRKVAVFDVREGKLKEYVDTESSDFLVAGGLTRFVVLDRTNSLLRRYNLDTLALERSGDAHFLGHVSALGMGVRSEGPIFLARTDEKRRPGFIDAVNLDSLNLRPLTRDDKIAPIDGECTVDVSADGTKVACDSNRPEAQILALSAGKLSVARVIRNQGYFWFRLAQNGEDTFSYQRRNFGTGESLQIGTLGSYLFAGDTYAPEITIGVSFGTRKNSGSIPLQFYCGRDPRPLARIFVEGGDYEKVPVLRLDRRVHCSLPEKAVVVVGDLPPRITLTRIDLDAAIAGNPAAPLVVSSSPPNTFPPQPDLTYRIEVPGNPTGVTFRLASGPTDMSVSPTGVVSWKAPPANDESQRGAIVVVSDNTGREFVHGFRVPSAAKDDVGTLVSGPGPSEQALTEGTFVPLPGGQTGRVVAGDGRYLLFSFGPWQKVGVFDMTTAKIARYIETGTTNFHVAGGATKFVVVDPAKREVKRYLLETGALEQTATYPGVPDGVGGIALGCASQGPLLMWDSAPLAGHATGLRVMDLDTLKFRLVDATKSKDIQDHLKDDFFSLTASADGRAFSPVWRDRRSTDRYETAILELAADRVVARRESIAATKKSRISYDGNAVTGAVRFSFVGGCDLDLKLLRSGNYTDALWWSEAFHGSGGRINVCFHQGRSTEKLAELEVTDPLGATDGENVAQRTHYSRLQKTLAVVNEIPSVVYARRYDAEAEIARNAVDHIAFNSIHPDIVHPGEKIKYQLTTISRDPVVKYHYVKGEQGMTVSLSGLLEWTAPTSMNGAVIEVTVNAVNSSGRAATESFRLKVREPSPGMKSGGSSPNTPVASTGLSPAALAAAKLPRKWTSSDGKSTITAAFVERKGGRVVLKPNKGSNIEVELSGLSAADQAHVERIDPTK